MHMESLPHQTTVTQVSTKNCILDSAIRLFTTQGYHGTSMRALGRACKVKESAVMHHIHSKIKLLEEVMEIVITYCQIELFKLPSNKTINLSQRIQLFIEKSRAFLTKYYAGSLMPLLALELADTTPIVKERACEYFKLWINGLSGLLHEKGYSPDKAELLAEQLVSELQGALLLNRLCYENGHIERVFERLERLLINP